MFKKVNQKVALALAAMLWMIIIICLTSFVPFILDPSRVTQDSFVSNLILIVAITIFGVINSMVASKSSNAANEKSNLSKARAKFFEIIRKITDFSPYYQWISLVKQPEDQKKKNDRLLKEVAISEGELYLSLSFEDLDRLLKTKSPIKIGEHYFDKLLPKQYDTIIRIKKGKENIRFVDPSYYTTIRSGETRITPTERASEENRVHTMNMIIGVGTKVVSTILFNVIIGMFVYDTSQGAITNAEAWVLLVQRMSALTTSSFVGNRIGTKDNDVAAGYVQDRINMYNEFVSSGYKGKSREELAKEKADKLKALEEKNDKMLKDKGE